MTTYFIPPRFENILNRQGVEFAPLLVAVDSDLKQFSRLALSAKVRGSGQLITVPGSTGVGKTSAIYGATVFLRSGFRSVIAVPEIVPIRDVAAWVRENLPDRQGEKIQPILLDGREVTDDTVGLSDLLTQLNQLLRRRSDLLVFWPTNDLAWHSTLRESALKVGGTAFVSSDMRIAGPSKAQWREVLQRLLTLSDQSLDRLGIDPTDVSMCEETASAVGEFLSGVGELVSDRIDLVQAEHGLPAITFVVTSGVEAIGQSNLLRRPTNFNLQPENVLHASRNSGVGRFWQARNDTPSQRLAYISTLFQVRLVAVTASAMTYACLEHGSDRLKSAVLEVGAKRNRGNFHRVFGASELYKYVKGTGTAELTSTPKGAMAQQTLDAYAAVQRLASAYDHELNDAIMASLVDVLGGEGLAASYHLEVDRGQARVFSDAVLTVEDDAHCFEFHHLSQGNCTAPTIAQYVMDKLKTYALHYQLIPT